MDRDNFWYNWRNEVKIGTQQYRYFIAFSE